MGIGMLRRHYDKGSTPQVEAGAGVEETPALAEPEVEVAPVETVEETTAPKAEKKTWRLPGRK